jgi:hypothetical protein
MGALSCFLISAALTGEPATMADVAFIAGHWQGRTAEGFSEEVWTAPEGDGMLGMWRWVEGGKAAVLELLTIRQEASGPVLRLRHFNGALVAREEKDKPVELPLVGKAAGEAVFEGRSAGGGVLRLIYRRDGDNGLSVTLEKDGQKTPFRFERASR